MPKLNLSVHPGLKARLDLLSKKFDLPQAELVRLALKNGLPLLEQVLEMEEKLINQIREYRDKMTKRDSGL